MTKQCADIKISPYTVTPSLKSKITDKIDLGVYKENVMYNIKKLPLLSEGVKLTDKFTIGYSFHPYTNGSFAYEHLNIVCYRGGCNRVLYFSSVETLCEFLDGFELVLDTKFAKAKIQECRAKIKRFELLYGL